MRLRRSGFVGEFKTDSDWNLFEGFSYLFSGAGSLLYSLLRFIFYPFTYIYGMIRPQKVEAY